MKKLIIAAAIVCAAAMSQASQFMWGTTGIKDYTGNASFSGTATLYVYLSSAGEGSATAMDTATMTNGAIANRLVSDDEQLIGGKMYSMYITMEDTANNYTFKSTTLSLTAPTGTQKPVKMFTSGSWTPAPEPTSAILMLLGMAGLALKRKRA